MLEFGDINWLAVVAATAAGFLLGGIWYGPLFGKAWMKAVGKTPDEIQPSPGPFVVSLVASVVTAVVLAGLIKSLEVTTPLEGALLGLIVSVGFIATAMGSDSAFCGWGLPLYLIQVGYRVTYCVIMGVILAWWQ